MSLIYFVDNLLLILLLRRGKTDDIRCVIYLVLIVHETTRIVGRHWLKTRQPLNEALNAATICDIDYLGNNMRLYYDSNRKYLQFSRVD